VRCLLSEPKLPFNTTPYLRQTGKEDNNSLSYTLRGPSSSRLRSGVSVEAHPSAGTSLPILLMRRRRRRRRRRVIAVRS